MRAGAGKSVASRRRPVAEAQGLPLEADLDGDDALRLQQIAAFGDETPEIGHRLVGRVEGTVRTDRGVVVVDVRRLAGLPEVRSAREDVEVDALRAGGKMNHVVGEQVLAQDRRDIGERAAGNLHADGGPAQRAYQVHVAVRVKCDGVRWMLLGPCGTERVVLVVAQEKVGAERLAPTFEKRKQVSGAAVVCERRRDAIHAQP